MNNSQNKEQQNNEKRKTLRLAWILYLVLLILVLVVSFAWFVNNRQVSLSTKDDEIQISVGSNIEFSLDGKKWYYEQEIPNVIELSYMDITSDGKTFYWPSALDEDDEAYMQASNFQDVTDSAGNYYLKRRIYFRTADVLDLYLDTNTKVHHAEQKKGENYSELTISGLISRDQNAKYNYPSAYGDFSACGIMAATRFAFSAITEPIEIDEDGNVVIKDDYDNGIELKCVYIPCDSYELRYNASGSGTGAAAAFLLSGSSEIETRGYSYITVEGGEAVKHTYEPMEYAQGKVLVDLASGNKNLAENGSHMINQAVSIISFTGNDGKMQYGALDVYIWCEGTDREADEALQGGKFTYTLSFTGINKNDISEEKDKTIVFADGTLKFEGGEDASGLIIYSFDGCKWMQFSSGNNPNFEGKDTVYARVKETNTAKAGRIQMIEIPESEEE